MRDRIHWHWQNLNDQPGDRGEATGNPLRHGRAWLRLWALTLHWEWVFGDFRCGVGFELDGEDSEVSGHLQMPLASIYWGIEGRPIAPLFRLLGMDYASCQARAEHDTALGNHRYAYQYLKRRFGLRINDWALWWSCMDTDDWSSTDPWWKSGAWHPLDTIFGRQKYSAELIEARALKVPMPEGNYEATARLERATWERPRWPWWPMKLVRLRVDIDVPSGIPIPGKGENSWDCGPDAIFSRMGGASIEEGVGELVASALETRRKRGAPANYCDRATGAVA